MSMPSEIKKPTEKQEVFMNALFGEAKGNIEEAKKIAEYHPEYSSGILMSILKDAIIERATIFLAINTPKAVMNLVGVVDDPVQPAAREKITAIKEILDRAGLVKTEKIQHSVEDISGVLILPAKKPVDEPEEV